MFEPSMSGVVRVNGAICVFACYKKPMLKIFEVKDTLEGLGFIVNIPVEQKGEWKYTPVDTLTNDNGTAFYQIRMRNGTANHLHNYQY
jgi:hypothetical protein